MFKKFFFLCGHVAPPSGENAVSLLYDLYECLSSTGVLLNKFHLWLKLVWFLYHNLKFRLPILPSLLLILLIISEAVVWWCSAKKLFLQSLQNSQGNTCFRVSFLMKLQSQRVELCQKKMPTPMFSCEFCEISHNSIFKKLKKESISAKKCRCRFQPGSK